MSEQLFTDGDVHQVNGKTLECVGVAYQEPDGEKQNFVYHFRLKSELDAEREAAAQVEAEQKAAAEGVEPEAPAEPVNQPETPKEETQYVK